MCGLFCLRLSLEMSFFKCKMWNQTNIPHAVFLIEPSWQQGPSKSSQAWRGSFYWSSLLMLSTYGHVIASVSAGIWAALGMTSPLFQKKRLGWNFSFLL